MWERVNAKIAVAYKSSRLTGHTDPPLQEGWLDHTTIFTNFCYKQFHINDDIILMSAQFVRYMELLVTKL